MQVSLEGYGSYRTRLPSGWTTKKTVPLGEYRFTPCKGHTWFESPRSTSISGQKLAQTMLLVCYLL